MLALKRGRHRRSQPVTINVISFPSKVNFTFYLKIYLYCLLFLQGAINLTSRPFLHCSTIIILISFVYLCTSCLNYFKWSLFIGVVLCAFITHHTRDAIRRGYWFYPWGNTNKLPNLAYIIITIATPYVIGYLYAFCRSAIVQQFLSQYIKLNDSCHHRDARGYRYMQV